MKFKFLGSIWFAVPLIIACIVSVVIATIFEGIYDSHEVASRLVYQNPLFSFLLFLFFLNILVSALNRWPWKMRHIPFLMTHLGLLMVIGGTIGKNVWGVQGHMLVAEGSGSDTIKIPGTYALAVTEVDKSRLITKTYPLMRYQASGFADSHLSLQLKHYTPHSQTELMTWMKPGGSVIMGLPPLPKQMLEDEQLPSTIRCRLGSDYWDVACVKTDDIEKLPKNGNTLYLAENDDKEIYLLACKRGEAYTASLENECVDVYGAYGRGFGGYTVEHKLPPHFSLDQQTWREGLEKYLSEAIANTPGELFEWMSVAEQNSNVNPLPFFEQFEKSPNWIYTGEDILPEWVSAFPWDKMETSTLNSCYWSTVLLPEMEKRLAAGLSLPKGWDCVEDPLPRLQREIFQMQDHLPLAKTEEMNKLSALSALFRLYELSYSTLLNGYQNSLTNEPISLEVPISQKVEALPSPPFGEKSTPAIVVEIKEEGKSDTIALAYEEGIDGFAWPVLDGKYLVKFQPEEMQIPHRVRLKRAQKILHPQTRDVESYLADVEIDKQVFQLKMNEVYETNSGYRFYLSQMIGEEGEHKKINLVVNHDPFRYPLTYPGAAFISLGAVLLLFLPKRNRQA